SDVCSSDLDPITVWQSSLNSATFGPEVPRSIASRVRPSPLMGRAVYAAPLVREGTYVVWTLVVAAALAAKPAAPPAAVKLAAPGLSGFNVSPAELEFFTEHFAQQLTLQ